MAFIVFNLSPSSSSQYDLCALIEGGLSDTWCPLFPDGQPCSCPLLQGDFNLTGLPVEVADFGAIFGTLMEVNTLCAIL